MPRPKPDKIPESNADLRQVYSDLARAKLEGRDVYGGHGGGLAGCTHYFRERYKITDEEAHALALRLQKTMVGHDVR